MSKYINVLLASVSFLWGTSFAAAKIAMYELLPLNLVILRFFLASSIFGIVLLTMRRNNTIEQADIPRFIVLGFMAITSYFYIQFTGLKFTTTINSALIIATSPIIVALFGALLKIERINKFACAGIMLAFLGVALVISNGNFSGLWKLDTLKGDLMLLLNAIVWAGVTLYGKKILQKYQPFVAMAYIHLFGTIMLLPFAFTPSFFAPVPLITQIGSVSAPTILAALYLAVFCSVYGYYVWYTGVEKIGAVRTAIYSYLNPLFTIITGMLLLKEKLSVYTVFGGVMVIIGVYLANKRRPALKSSGS